MPEPSNQQLALKYFKKAYECQIKGDLERAEEYYLLSIRTFPTAEAHTFLGWTYSFKKSYRKAIEECQKAILLDPEFGNPYNDIGAYWIELENLDEAIPWLERAIQAKRYQSYHYPYFNLGRIYVIKEMYSRALECFQKSAEIAPDYILARKAMEELRRKIN